MIKILLILPLFLIFFSFFQVVEAPSHPIGFTPPPDPVTDFGCPEGQITTGDPNNPCRIPMIQELFLLPAPILMIFMIIVIILIVVAILVIRRVRRKR